MPKENTRRITPLPEGYYLEHFNFILRFISEKQYQILSLDERQTLLEYSNLSPDAQMLYVRLFNRKRRVFCLDSLNYTEITHLLHAERALIESGFATREVADDLLSDFLLQQSVAHLRKLNKKLQLGNPEKTSKSELAPLIASQVPSDELKKHFDFSNLVSLLRRDTFEFFLFIFFGNLRYDLSAFVLKDLDQTRGHANTASELTPRFSSREEALETRRFAQLKQDLYLIPAEELETWALRIHQMPPPHTPLALRKYESLCFYVARELEREKRLELALQLYQHTPSHPSRERRVRVLFKLGKPEQAYLLLEEIAENPRCAEERIFAEDYLRKRKQPKSTRQTRKAKRQASDIFLARRWRRQPEEGVVAKLNESGLCAFHTENRLWRSFFGLLFWDLLFDTNRNSFHTPFEQLPREFKFGTLFAGMKTEVEQSIGLIEDETNFLNVIQERYLQYFRTKNPFVSWTPETLKLIAEIRQRLPARALQAVAREMSQNPEHNLCGFPDLLVLEDSQVRFLEVKTPLDQLSAQQLHWLQVFRQHGIEADVLQIRWATR